MVSLITDEQNDGHPTEPYFSSLCVQNEQQEALMDSSDRTLSFLNKWKPFFSALIVLVIAGILLMRFTGHSYVAFHDSYFSISDSGSHISEDIAYSDVASVEYYNALDLGTPVEGENGMREQWGIWENETFGEYTLTADRNISVYVCVKDQEGNIYVFNYESASTTEQIYTMLLDLTGAGD